MAVNILPVVNNRGVGAIGPAVEAANQWRSEFSAAVNQARAGVSAAKGVAYQPGGTATGGQQVTQPITSNPNTAPYQTGWTSPYKTSDMNQMQPWAWFTTDAAGNIVLDQNAVLANLIQQHQTASNEGKAANEQRYADILDGYRASLGTTLNQLGSISHQGAADIQQRHHNQLSGRYQDLVSSGLYNTTARQGAAASQTRAMQGDLADYDQSNRQQQLNAYLGGTGDILGFMERRSDNYPSWSTLVQLAQALGQAG